MKATNKVRQEWDTEFATYFWQIHLDTNHSYNRTALITGYSKVRKQMEAQDKDYLLKRKICMLYKHGYFSRMKHIDMFQKSGAVIDKNKADKILVLYPKYYDIPEFQHDVTLKKHGPWLKTFYDLINAGKSIESILPAVRKSGSNVDKDEFLKVENYLHFTNIGQVYTHAATLDEYGHPPGAIEGFIKKFKTLKGW